MGEDALSGYRSPLAERNASREMQAIWSAGRKYGAWRRIWLALAEAERELGLPITEEQLAALRGAQDVTPEDLARAGEHERRLRHDVMAHVHALGDRAPAARGIIHLGATSQDVNCNAELPQIRDALALVCVKTARVIDALGSFAQRWRDLPCLAMTHLQPAQPTTVGKRAAVWAHDLALCLERLERTQGSIRLRGMRGATGTQASYLTLFEGDAAKAEALDREVVERLGFGDAYVVTGQTYPRVVDAFVVSDLAALAAATHKMCNDIRILASRRELDEPFGESQIGSSAMPYKRNPMRCERATGLCRLVMTFAQSPLDTAATQWLERTLDDSANRRVALPEPFLAMDGALDLAHGVAAGLVVHERVVRANLMAELPFLATEALMMEAARRGVDRQEAHEAIRRHSHAAAARMKEEGAPNDLIDRLRAEPLLAGVRIDDALDPARHVGLAPRQVDRFLGEVCAPIRERYAGSLGDPSDPGV